MLMARRNMMVSGATWKNPYITDGLVMLVDPEGSGGEFKEIMSGGNVTCSPRISYDSSKKALVFSGNGTISYPITEALNEAFMSGNITIEMCCYIVPYRSAEYRSLIQVVMSPYINIYTPRSTGTQRYLYYNGYGRVNSVSTYLDEDGTAKGTMQVSFDWQKQVTRRFKTGVFTGSATITTLPSVDATSFTTNLMGGAEVYSLRIYNRPLTDAEILANATIDKARFGLT